VTKVQSSTPFTVERKKFVLMPLSDMAPNVEEGKVITITE
jgi:hypothetical protein